MKDNGLKTILTELEPLLSKTKMYSKDLSKMVNSMDSVNIFTKTKDIMKVNGLTINGMVKVNMLKLPETS